MGEHRIKRKDAAQFSEIIRDLAERAADANTRAVLIDQEDP